jgi:hypothetical protein
MAGIMNYEDWLKGAGSPYANQYSQEALNAEFDPFYNQQLGGEDYNKQLAQEQLGRTTQDTQRAYGQSFSDRGIYGSGIYQTELSNQLGNLNRGFEQNYGSGQYTPYSMRKQQILENAKIAKASTGLQRQNQAWNVYSQQFYPNLVT